MRYNTKKRRERRDIIHETLRCILPKCLVRIITDYVPRSEDDESEVLEKILEAHTMEDGCGKIVVEELVEISWWPAFDDYRLKTYYVTLLGYHKNAWYNSSDGREISFFDMLPSRGSGYKILRDIPGNPRLEVKTYYKHMFNLFKQF